MKLEIEVHRKLVNSEADSYVACWDMLLASSWPREKGPADEDPSWLYLPCLGGRSGRLYSDIAPIISKLERMGLLERHPRHETLIRHHRLAA